MKMYETSNEVRFKVLKQIISNSKSITSAFSPLPKPILNCYVFGLLNFKTRLWPEMLPETESL